MVNAHAQSAVSIIDPENRILKVACHSVLPMRRKVSIIDPENRILKVEVLQRHRHGTVVSIIDPENRILKAVLAPPISSRRARLNHRSGE